jgi:hypothetical protein
MTVSPVDLGRVPRAYWDSYSRSGVLPRTTPTDGSNYDACTIDTHHDPHHREKESHVKPT